MPALTEEDRVVPRDSPVVDERQSHSVSLKLDVSCQSEWLVNDENVANDEYLNQGVNMNHKVDIDEGPEGCRVFTALRQSTLCDLATSTQPDGVSAKEGNCGVITEKKDTVLNDESNSLVETSKEMNSYQDQKKPEGEMQGKEMNEPDVDGGWGYMVLLGTFIIMTVIAILGPGFGILFSEFLTNMKASSVITTAIFNSESFAWSVSNMLAGPVTEQFGWQAVATVGGLLCFSGMMASAYAPSASFLFFSHTILFGFGSGASCLVAFAVIPHYFKRLLGRANAITTAGMCAGGMIGPPMMTYLQQQFGFKGATIIAAALALHICLAAAMFRPVQTPSKVKESTTTRLGPCQIMGQMICSIGRNCLLLKSLRVMIIAVGGAFVVGIYLNIFLLVPFVMEEKGHTQETAAWCMSISNLTNLAGRLIVSSLSDVAWFNVVACYIAFATLLSLSTIVFSLMQEVTWLTVTLALWGSGIGSCMSLYPIIMVKYMGLDLYVGVLGVTGVVNGIWMLCCGSFVGLIRDWSGSYTASLIVLGTSGLLTSVLFLFMPFAIAYDKGKEEQQRPKDTEVGG